MALETPMPTNLEVHGREKMPMSNIAACNGRIGSRSSLRRNTVAGHRYMRAISMSLALDRMSPAEWSHAK